MRGGRVLDLSPATAAPLRNTTLRVIMQGVLAGGSCGGKVTLGLVASRQAHMGRCILRIKPDNPLIQRYCLVRVPLR